LRRIASADGAFGLTGTGENPAIESGCGAAAI
jgi:hypothetical protein